MQQNRRNSILLGADNNALMWLIAINAVVFVLVFFIKIIYNYYYLPIHKPDGKLVIQLLFA